MLKVWLGMETLYITKQILMTVLLFCETYIHIKIHTCPVHSTLHARKWFLNACFHLTKRDHILDVRSSPSSFKWNPYSSPYAKVPWLRMCVVGLSPAPSTQILRAHDAGKRLFHLDIVIFVRTPPSSNSPLCHHSICYLPIMSSLPTRVPTKRTSLFSLHIPPAIRWDSLIHFN